MKDDLPGGPGFVYEKSSNGFKWRSMMKCSNWSLESIEWLNFQQNLSPFTVDGERRHVIRHSLNGGEFELKSRTKLYKVDGYTKIDGVSYFFEYNGCHWHHCPDCETGDGKRKLTDKKKREFLQSKGVLKSITSCQWQKLKKTVRYRNYTSVFFNHKGLIKEETLLRSIESRKLFGMVECSVRCPDHVVKHFASINHPPIYRHLQVNMSMLSEEMKKRLKEKKIKELDKQLSLTFHAEEILLTTEFICFYLELGMEIYDIKMVIEFERDRYSD